MKTELINMKSEMASMKDRIENLEMIKIEKD